VALDASCSRVTSPLTTCVDVVLARISTLALCEGLASLHRIVVFYQM
jgi:hypothetical protein